MKKISTLLVALMATVVSANAIDFAYDAGAEVVSAYIWRGQYNGGLSLQPDVEVGFNALDESLQFRIGAWANIGASDWTFKKGLATYMDADGNEIDPNTRFVPELDIVGSLSVFGVTVGFNHYYYFGGSNFFSWQPVADLAVSDNTSTTEIWAGLNLGELTKAGLYFNWFTTIAGQDLVFDDNLSDYKRAWSSYFEVGYDYTFESAGVTLGAVVGMSPWESPMYGNSKFAVTNISLKVNKEWEFDHITLDLFAQGTLNPDGVNKENAVLWKASGDEKLYNQKLNGVIGLGFWF
ncbi:MAG: hypothetical protein IJ814_02410 [Paludibacteraceae bacterium]|nr:hypothetical protein [Paludibacteraceae bacterium]